jgi:hypothetical protein
VFSCSCLSLSSHTYQYSGWAHKVTTKAYLGENIYCLTIEVPSASRPGLYIPVIADTTGGAGVGADISGAPSFPGASASTVRLCTMALHSNQRKLRHRYRLYGTQCALETTEPSHNSPQGTYQPMHVSPCHYCSFIILIQLSSVTALIGPFPVFKHVV